MFKALSNIESSFKQLKRFVIIYTICGTILIIFSITASYLFAEKQREKIYVLDNGKSLMLALSQDMAQNRPVEAKDHVKRFHELFFTLSPDDNAIKNNINRALYLADKSAYDYYKDMTENKYYDRMIKFNMNQNIKIDSLICNFDVYPYTVKTYCVQTIMRNSNITKRNLISSCLLINSQRSDNNPHGFLIENFTILNNSDISTTERVNISENQKPI